MALLFASVDLVDEPACCDVCVKYLKLSADITNSLVSSLVSGRMCQERLFDNGIEVASNTPEKQGNKIEDNIEPIIIVFFMLLIFLAVVPFFLTYQSVFVAVDG
jgi:hypothetical protein